MYLKDHSPAFEKWHFDDAALLTEQRIVSTASAGRGTTLFISIDDQTLVLRRYRRGGMVRMLSERHYIWTGLSRTRAWQEFNVLLALQALDLPAPKAYAVEVIRRGPMYSASLISHFLPGETLGDQVISKPVSNDVWLQLGRCIARFHNAGLNHADLNVHNVLITEDEQVALLDFDKARFEKINGAWCKANLDRLKRSLNKVVSSGPAHYVDDNWQQLIMGYKQVLTQTTD